MRKLMPFLALLGFLSIEACRTTVVEKDRRGGPGYREGYREGARDEHREEHHDHH